MRKKTTYLLLAGATAALGMVAAIAFIGQWRTPANVASATAPSYDSTAPTLRPAVHGRDKPIVAVVADNEGTETTDFIVPYGILKESGVVDVRAVASESGVIELMPALRVRAEKTIADFERDVPLGADIVIVPAMHRQDNPVILEFLKRQAASGALIVSICDGAWVVANAGLFEGRQATGHWFSFDGLARAFPQTTWVRNARIVSDGPVMSTTGVSASVPVSLALVELLSDRATADELADRLHVDDWNSEHDSDAFRLTGQMVGTGLGNLASFWGHETFGVEVTDGFDEIAFALQADAWSRTFRSNLFAVNRDGQVASDRGLTFVAERELGDAQSMALAPGGATAALDGTLANIEERYGQKTSRFVSDQLEYAWAARPELTR